MATAPTSSSLNKSFDVLIIGSGAAGLTCALHLPNHLQVAVVSKGELAGGSTLYAQGGISAVLDQGDSLASHIADTLAAGDGLCRAKAVEFAVTEGPEAVRWLINQGVPFTSADNSQSQGLHLTREGGHSHRRVIHAEDRTGKAVETTLEALTRAASNIHVFEHHLAIDLIVDDNDIDNKCLGAWLLDRQSGVVTTVAANATVLACGGANMVYRYSSNPHSSTGDGIAMAWRAGCRIANMEFMQFHPTCLYHPSARGFLLTEAIRGEGGRLLLSNGQRFMEAYHPQAELAPRDIVARAIDAEIKKAGDEHIWLDISHRDADFIRSHFPGVYERCMELGLDMTKEPLPVVPAAHYTCGGVLTDLQGRTDLPQLYAIGETASTGLHGANRMASNSLLECIVYGRASAQDISRRPQQPLTQALPQWDDSRVTEEDEAVVVSHNWHELRKLMWDYVGIVRSNNRLERAQNRLALLHKEIEEYYASYHVSPDFIELRNLMQVADLIVKSATLRKESRGLHYNRDYPQKRDGARATVLTPPNSASYDNSPSW